MDVLDISLNAQIINTLKMAGLDDTDKLSSFTWSQLRDAAGLTFEQLREIILNLDVKGIRLSDCSKNDYYSIDNYIRFVGRQIRIEGCQTIRIDVLPPDPGKYTKGGKGYTIYFNIDNLTDEPIKLSLKEIGIYSCNRQWMSDYNYTGYSLDGEYVFPSTPRTVGKIWITEGTANAGLSAGDHLTLLLENKGSGLSYFFKFLYTDNETWQINDYYELKN